jgi:hypothetical protein
MSDIKDVERELNCATSVMYDPEASVNHRVNHDLHAAGMHLLRALNAVELGDGEVWGYIWQAYNKLNTVQEWVYRSQMGRKTGK